MLQEADIKARKSSRVIKEIVTRGSRQKEKDKDKEKQAYDILYDTWVGQGKHVVGNLLFTIKIAIGIVIVILVVFPLIGIGMVWTFVSKMSGLCLSTGLAFVCRAMMFVVG